MQEFILNYTTCGKIVGDKLYFSEKDFNGLFCFNMKLGECEFVDLFEGEEINEFDLHRKCVLYHDQLFFLPQRSNFIHMYNTKTGEQNTILVENRKDRTPQFLYEAIQCGCYLYNVPTHIDMPLLRLNMDKQIIEKDYRFSDWCKEHLPDTGQLFGSRAAYRDDYIYVVIFDSDLVLRWNIHSGEGEVYRVAKRLFGIANASDGFWLISLECSDIFHWNPESGMKKYIGLQKWQGVKPYNHIIQVEGVAVAIPTFAADKLIIKEDTEDKFKVCDFSGVLGEGLKKDGSFYGIDSDGGILYIFFAVGQGCLVLDTKSKKIDQVFMRLSNPKQIEKIEAVRKAERVKNRMHAGYPVWECKEWSLINLIADTEDCILNNIESKVKFGKSIYQELCGKK